MPAGQPLHSFEVAGLAEAGNAQVLTVCFPSVAPGAA